MNQRSHPTAVQICQDWGERESLWSAMMVNAKVHFFFGEYDQFERLYEQGLHMAEEISPHCVAFSTHYKNHFDLLQGKTAGTEKWVRDHELNVDDTFE